MATYWCESSSIVILRDFFRYVGRYRGKVLSEQPLNSGVLAVDHYLAFGTMSPFCQPKRAAINDPLIDALTSKLPQAVVIRLIIG